MRLASLLSGLAAMLGFGGKHSLNPTGGDPQRPYVAPKDIRPTHVYRGGRHSRTAIGCPACFHYTSKRGLCMNRMCFRFNAATARTHPDLLSLHRGVRLNAQARWERGGMAALWAR